MRKSVIMVFRAEKALSDAVAKAAKKAEETFSGYIYQSVLKRLRVTLKAEFPKIQRSIEAAEKLNKKNGPVKGQGGRPPKPNDKSNGKSNGKASTERKAAKKGKASSKSVKKKARVKGKKGKSKKNRLLVG